MSAEQLRQQLVNIALEWQSKYGVAPAITSALSEYDAAVLVGMPLDEYSDFMRGRSAVSKGADIIWKGIRYQIKANRPSGRPGSQVTLAPKPKNINWDKLIWILYDTDYCIQEAWMWDIAEYNAQLAQLSRLRPKNMRMGKSLIIPR